MDVWVDGWTDGCIGVWAWDGWMDELMSVCLLCIFARVFRLFG